MFFLSFKNYKSIFSVMQCIKTKYWHSALGLLLSMIFVLTITYIPLFLVDFYYGCSFFD